MSDNFCWTPDFFICITIGGQEKERDKGDDELV
nr:MAG TPA: hypothetical protein [Caudoviricetes sp.]